MGSGDRARALALYAAVGAGAAAPPLAVLLAGHSLLWRDTANLFAPLRGVVVDALRRLELPLWNPHEALGIPLFAQMLHGVLHPVSVAGAFLAPRAGLDAFIVVHVVLAALGATWLARTLACSRGAAAVAGLGYGLSGYVLGMSAVIQYLTAAATAPWAMAGLRAAATGERRGLALAAAGVGALHLAGDPQWTILAVLLGLLLALEGGGSRALARAAGAVVLGTALAAVQLVPAWAFLGETVRAGGLTAADRSQWALAPARLVELVAPGFFLGRPGTTEVAPVFQWLGGPSAPHLGLPFVPSVCAGAALVALAAAGVGAARVGRLLGATVPVLLWLALGRAAGAEQALHWVPVWGAFRYAEKLVGPLTLVLALLAALGADRLAARPRRAVAAAAASGAALAGLAALLLGAGPGLDRLVAGDLARYAAPVARVRLATGLGHAGVGLALLAVLIEAARRQPRWRGRVAAAAAGLVVAQAAAASPFALRASAPGVRAEAPLSALAATAGPVRIVTPLEDPPYGGPPGLDPADRETAALSRMGVAPFAVASGIDHVNAYTGLRPRRLRLAFEALGPDLWQTLRRFALTHVVVRQPASPAEMDDARRAVAGGRLLLGDPVWGFSVWEVPHRPWAVFATDVVSAGGEAAALAALVDAGRRGGTGPAILETPIAAPVAPGEVLAVERVRERVRVEARGDGDGLLVVNDAFGAGWTATLDGRPWPVLRADFLVRAVPWPAGRHVLEMRYEAPGLGVGSAVSLAALLGIGALAAPSRRRRPGGAGATPADGRVR